MGATAGITMAGASLAGAYSQYNALDAQNEYQKQQAAANIRLSKLNEKQALRRGDQVAAQVKRRAGQIVGAQKAASVGQGVQVDVGSAYELQQETLDNAQIDMMTARNNAWREAWGYRVEQSNIAAGSRFASLAARSQQQSTLITGGLRAAAYGGMAYQAYKEGQLTDKYIGEGTVEELPASNNPEEQYEKADRMVASEKERIESELDTSLAGPRPRNRSRQNPLFPGYELTSSWYVYS